MQLSRPDLSSFLSNMIFKMNVQLKPRQSWSMKYEMTDLSCGGIKQFGKARRREGLSKLVKRTRGIYSYYGFLEHNQRWKSYA